MRFGGEDLKVYLYRDPVDMRSYAQRLLFNTPGGGRPLRENPCRSGRAAADSRPMSCVAAPSGLDDRPMAPIAPRWLTPSGRKSAHRGLAAYRRPASAKPCSQALIASGKTPRLPTTARRSHLLPQSNPQQKPTNKPGACSDLSSFACQACVTTYLNNTYGNFGGFIASTFNAQQSIPGLSGQSLFNTLAPTAEIGLAKFGAGQGLQFGGDFIAMNTSGAGCFWLGTSLEYAGVMVAPVLGVIGAETTPFATVATSIARSACGG